MEIDSTITFYTKKSLEYVYNRSLSDTVNCDKKTQEERLREDIKEFLEMIKRILNKAIEYLDNSPYSPYLNARWDMLQEEILEMFHSSFFEEREDFNDCQKEIQDFLSYLVKELDREFVFTSVELFGMPVEEKTLLINGKSIHFWDCVKKTEIYNAYYNLDDHNLMSLLETGLDYYEQDSEQILEFEYGEFAYIFKSK